MLMNFMKLCMNHIVLVVNLKMRIKLHQVKMILEKINL